MPDEALRTFLLVELADILVERGFRVSTHNPRVLVVQSGIHKAYVTCLPEQAIWNCSMSVGQALMHLYSSIQFSEPLENIVKLLDNWLNNSTVEISG